MIFLMGLMIIGLAVLDGGQIWLLKHTSWLFDFVWLEAD